MKFVVGFNRFPTILAHMIRPSLLIALMILPLVTFSQTSNSSYENQLKLSLFRTINILNPGIEISYETLYSKRTATQFSAGIATNVAGKQFEKLHGYNIGLEQKYFSSRNNKSSKYFSGIFGYSDTKYQEKTSGKDPVTNVNIIDTFAIARKVTSLGLTYGLQLYQGYFVFDINLGAGLSYRNVKHRDRILEYKGPREPFDLQRAANVERKGFTFYLPINIQLGYRF